MPNSIDIPGRTALLAAALTAATVWLAAPAAIAAEDASFAVLSPAEQGRQYDAPGRKSVVELQQFRRGDVVAVSQPDGRRGTAALINLNPAVNAWFLLTLRWEGSEAVTWHLENAAPDMQQLRLVDGTPGSIRISGEDGATECSLWSARPSALDRAEQSALPYAPLCDRRLYLRNEVRGHRTNLERIADFLRDHVWSGESIVRFVRDEVLRDRLAETAKLGDEAGSPSQPQGAPVPADVAPAFAGRSVPAASLGIRVSGAPSNQLAVGRWYAASGLPGVFVSAIEPRVIADDVLSSHRDRVNSLDSVEASALAYLIAFDLDAFALRFAMGTDHPRLDWSPRPPAQVREPSLPGPDGFATADPLALTGMVTPAVSGGVAATFTGGFKRQHGAFRYGDFATRNRGSHYGFVEQGVVLSKLQPGLATLYVLDDGTIDMKSWTAADDRRLEQVAFARQNGVALIESKPASGPPVPGALVNRWGPGNWSGSADAQLRTLRAGACLIEDAGGRFLVYGYFSSATPSAMARVFQAYGCRYAMLLDMNALEHTYLAVYPRQGESVVVEHLVKGMAQIDKTERGQLIPRFLGFPDNRDFFYLVRREEQ